MNNIISSDGIESIDEIRMNFWKWGHSKIHVLADFDRTLTKNFVDGEEKPSLTSVLRREGILWQEYAKKATDLYNHYYPIEISSTISLQQKKEEMTIWWETHMQLLVDTWINQKDIEYAVWLGKIELRDWVKEFLQFLDNKNIPLVIMSANALGIESIHDFLELEGYNMNNIDIISNWFIWDKSGKAIGYKQPLIHTFNKDETTLSSFPDISNKISDRKNVILLWDSEGDPGMIEWFDADNLLKVWFLNKNKEELEQRYRQLYDVVICDDGNFDFINTFLENI